MKRFDAMALLVAAEGIIRRDAARTVEAMVNRKNKIVTGVALLSQTASMPIVVSFSNDNEATSTT
jgi:hypothetical protein